ncbi:MAG: hypothetical protein ACSLE5_04890 [Porticoccaceae bacterium]
MIDGDKVAKAHRQILRLNSGGAIAIRLPRRNHHRLVIAPARCGQ